MRQEQLKRIRKAYDLTARQYREGSDPLAAFPEEFRNSAALKSFMREAGPEITGSGAPGIREFLAPRAGMKLLDAGGCANLASYRFDRWPSLYYGVDISPELIQAMKRFAARGNIVVGGMELAEAAELPFADDFFDIAMAIGVLEYMDPEYAGRALAELGRVLRTGARAVFDIPNMEHPHAATMFRLEECLARPIFPHPRAELEKMLARHFNIDKIDGHQVMLKYFVRRKSRDRGIRIRS
jgi:SAM-dependent methyltransferase